MSIFVYQTIAFDFACFKLDKSFPIKWHSYKGVLGYKGKPVHTGLYLVRIGLCLDGTPFLFLKTFCND
jgi:hypothetical protein